jgi:hypothetical protein
VAPLAGIDYLLDAIGFHNPVEHLRLVQIGLADYEDFCYLVQKDIQDMVEKFSKQMVAQGHNTFNLGCIKKLTGVMHWVQDCFRTNNDPDHTVFNEKVLAKAQSRALICKSDIDLVDTNTTAANPSKFKDKHKWPEWSKAFSNYLLVIPGVSGIPLV